MLRMPVSRGLCRIVLEGQLFLTKLLQKKKRIFRFKVLGRRQIRSRFGSLASNACVRRIVQNRLGRAALPYKITTKKEKNFSFQGFGKTPNSKSFWKPCFECLFQGDCAESSWKGSSSLQNYYKKRKEFFVSRFWEDAKFEVVLEALLRMRVLGG